jgi:hypothetical protein
MIEQVVYLGGLNRHWFPIKIIIYVRKKLRVIILYEKLQNRLVPIYLKITVDGKPTELSAKRKWDLAKWSTAAGRAVGIKEESQELNYYLNAP